MKAFRNTRNNFVSRSNIYIFQYNLALNRTTNAPENKLQIHQVLLKDCVVLINMLERRLSLTVPVNNIDSSAFNYGYGKTFPHRLTKRVIFVTIPDILIAIRSSDRHCDHLQM